MGVIHFHYHYRKDVPAEIAEQAITLAPRQKIKLTRRILEDGRIDRIRVFKPSGQKLTCPIRVFHNGVQILPDQGYYFLEDQSETIPIGRDCSKGDGITVEVSNFDEYNERSIGVDVIIAPKPKKE